MPRLTRPRPPRGKAWSASAIDAGAGYTYFNPATGKEASAVVGLTYNLENPDTDYQNGVDLHVDWAASQFLNENIFVTTSATGTSAPITKG